MEASEVKQLNGLYGFDYREFDKRRTPEGEERNPKLNIKQLWQVSHEIINLAARGFKYKQIAEILNVHPVTVSNTLNSDLGKMKLSQVRLERDEEAKKVSEKIRVLTNKALQTYHEIFDDNSGQTSLKDKKAVADTVLLELSGLRAPTRIQSHNISTVLTKDEIKELRERGIKAAQDAGFVVDAEVIDEESTRVDEGSGHSQRSQDLRISDSSDEDNRGGEEVEGATQEDRLDL